MSSVPRQDGIAEPETHQEIPDGDAPDRRKRAEASSREDGGGFWVIVTIAAACGAGIIILMTATISGGSSGWAILAPFGIVLLVFIAIGVGFAWIRIDEHLARQRQLQAERFRDAALAQGMTYEPEGDKEFRNAWSALPEIPQQGRVRHLLYGEVRGMRLTAFEHRYTVHTGQAPVTIVHSVYAAEAPGWPELHISKRGWVSRRRVRKGMSKGIMTGDAGFDQVFEVKSDDERLVSTLLDAQMREFLLERPDVRWHTVGEHVCLVYRGHLRHDKISDSIDRMERFFDAVPQAVYELPASRR